MTAFERIVLKHTIQKRGAFGPFFFVKYLFQLNRKEYLCKLKLPIKSLLMKTTVNLLIFVLTLTLFACNSDVSKEGDVFFNEGNYKEAVDSYTEYLATRPKDIKSLYNRGRAYEEMNRLDKAKADFLTILDLDGNNLNANLSMGSYWYNQKDFNRAIKFFDKVIEVDGRKSEAYMLRGRSYHQLGEFKDAMVNYNFAIDFDKDNEDAFLYRGALKIALGQNRSACQDFGRARALGSEEAKIALAKHCN
ncbi:MAG: tetratricopeptide (TPR) repeat protein [Roseivirga sp.]